MDEVELRILEGRFCPYCNCETKLVSGEKVYPQMIKDDPRPSFLDKKYYVYNENSDHYVGTYADNKTSLGIVADKELRKLKNLDHKTFDPLWKEKTHFKKQKQAYKWLSEKMNLPLKYTHFGMFTNEQCIEAIKCCINLIEENHES